MKCEKCGYESEQDFSFCPTCGAAVQETAPQESIVPTNSAADKILRVLQDQLFFVLCILISACCALQLIGGSFNVLTILFTIFLWLTYAQARKGVADVKQLRCLSGTVYAEYVLVNVLSILLIVFGAIIGAAFGILVSDPTSLNEILSTFDAVSVDTAMLTQVVGSLSGIVIFIIFAFIGAVMLVVNLFSTRYIHRFAKSVYQSVESGALELKHAKTAYGWLLAFGIFDGLSFLSTLGSGDFAAILASGAACAAPIVAALLIKKYLLTDE